MLHHLLLRGHHFTANFALSMSMNIPLMNRHIVLSLNNFTAKFALDFIIKRNSMHFHVCLKLLIIIIECHVTVTACEDLRRQMRENVRQKSLLRRRLKITKVTKIQKISIFLCRSRFALMRALDVNDHPLGIQNSSITERAILIDVVIV